MDESVPVLVVDDSRPFRLAAAAVLRASPGFVLVGEAEDGAQALAQVAALAPALVLMDVRMPVMDGLEATRRIVADHPGTRVVLCSTYEQADLPEQAAASGAWAYVSKEDLRPDVLAGLWAAPAPG